MKKLKMYQFMGDTESNKANEVTTSFDPTVIRKKKKQQTLSESKNESIGSSMSNMGLSSALGKDERIFALITAFDKNEIFTISSAAEKLQVTYQTAKKYAKEANLKLYDDLKKTYLDGRLPKNK